jgi:2-phospho-L-lactate guanylyltransferase
VRTAAVLPVKSFSRAKQRLREAVGGDEREALAAAMVGDVLAALARVPQLDDVLVVTAEPLAARAAEEAGATVVHDPEEAGQSAAAARGIDAALVRGAERVLLVPGDCPALDPREIADLLVRSGEVVIVPDRHGSGTNALLLAPPTIMPPSFGEGSFARHAVLARAAGAAISVRELPSLGLDVDTPDDLAALRRALERRGEAAPRTRAVLDRLVSAATV